MRTFSPEELEKLAKRTDVSKNGQVTIVGGSDLFHGAPILSLRVASRIVDMVYFSSSEPSIGKVAEHLKLQLSSFIWVPWEEVEDYVAKSNSVLVGPGMKRWHLERERPNDGERMLDGAGTETKFITQRLLRRFPDKRWVIDGGALQVMETSWIPKDSILTPNKKEFSLLFKIDPTAENAEKMAKEHKCIVVLKSPVNYVCSQDECVEVRGGNAGMTKGGTGDVLAGLTVGLAARNNALLASSAASWVIKKAGDSLYERVGTSYNADDLAEEIPLVLGKYLK